MRRRTDSPVVAKATNQKNRTVNRMSNKFLNPFTIYGRRAKLKDHNENSGARALSRTHHVHTITLCEPSTKTRTERTNSLKRPTCVHFCAVQSFEKVVL